MRHLTMNKWAKMIRPRNLTQQLSMSPLIRYMGQGFEQWLPSMMFRMVAFHILKMLPLRWCKYIHLSNLYSPSIALNMVWQMMLVAMWCRYCNWSKRLYLY
jgi:hypothetical protein